MTQFLSLHPCNNPQRLWVIWRYILRYSDATSADQIRCDIYYQSIFCTKLENHLNESSENISYIQAKSPNSHPQTNISVICTSIDCMTFCHDIQKANICCIEQASNKNVELILLIGSRCITLLMLYVISVCWLLTVLINICLFSVAYSSWVFPVLLQRQISIVINSGLNCSSSCCCDSIRLFNSSFSFWSENFIRYAVGFFFLLLLCVYVCTLLEGRHN